MDSQFILELGILLACYLFGSIPFSVLLGTKIKGIDVREHGSGNPGGTNSIRWLGKALGFSIIFLDALKGGLVILLIRFGVINVEYIDPLFFGVIGAFGHVYPVFLKFKGGKAVAATMGLLLGYNFLWSFIAVAVFFLVVKISKYVSIGSTAIAVTMVVLSLTWAAFDIQWFGISVLPEGSNFVTHELVYLVFMLALIVFRHQSNYRNIRNGVEPKVGWAQKKATK